MGEQKWESEGGCVTGFALCSLLPWCSHGTAATRCAEHPVSSFPLGLFRQ